MPIRRSPRGATAGRSPAPAEAYIPALGTFHAAVHPQPATRAAPSRRSPRPPRRAHPRPGGGGHVAGTRNPLYAGPRRARSSPLRGTLRARVCTPRRSPGSARRARLVGACDWAWATPSTIRIYAAPRQPHGAARQARALRLQDRLASLASCEPRAPVWTRLRPSGSACGAGSLRSRSTGRGRPCGRGYALRAPPVELGRFAPAPPAAGTEPCGFPSRVTSTARVPGAAAAPSFTDGSGRG